MMTCRSRKRGCGPAGHEIYRSQPERVIEEIERILDEVQ